MSDFAMRYRKVKEKDNLILPLIPSHYTPLIFSERLDDMDDIGLSSKI